MYKEAVALGPLYFLSNLIKIFYQGLKNCLKISDLRAFE